eukprot:4937566-Pyramimonas_sp.AAC.2
MGRLSDEGGSSCTLERGWLANVPSWQTRVSCESVCARVLIRKAIRRVSKGDAVPLQGQKLHRHSSDQGRG